MAETVELAIVWAEHFEKNKQWELAAGVWERIGAFAAHRNAANAKIVQCFLKPGNVAEAEKRSEAMAETVELAIVWAEHFEETADWEKAVEIWRECVDKFKDINSEFGLMIALDRIGEYEEADTLARQINIERETDAFSDAARALDDRRRAYLLLRENRVEEVLEIVDALRDGPEHIRVLLLASVGLHFKGDSDIAFDTMREAKPEPTDCAWILNIAAGYFNRYAPEMLGDFKSALTDLESLK
jgi:tetratricopeptide (TPR) repeat protein